MIVRPFANSKNEFSWKTVDTAIPKKLYRPPCHVSRYFATNWMRNSMFHQLKGFMNLLALSMHFESWRSFLFIEIIIYTRRLFTLVRYCYIDVSRMLWIAHYKDLICDKHKYYTADKIKHGKRRKKGKEKKNLWEWNPKQIVLLLSIRSSVLRRRWDSATRFYWHLCEWL